MESARLKIDMSETGLAVEQTGPFAGSNPALGTIKFNTADCTKARDRYKPSHVLVLFIAESPPSSGGYFYFTQTIGKDHLFRETMKALRFWPETRPMRKGLDKRSLLNRFCSAGFFLIDTCQIPVDKLNTTARRASIANGAADLPRRVGHLDPDKILILKKTVYQPALDSLEAAGWNKRILNSRAIPFPSHGNQRQYRREVGRLLQVR